MPFMLGGTACRCYTVVMRARRLITLTTLTLTASALAGAVAWNVEPFAGRLREIAVDPQVREWERRATSAAIVRARFADLAPGTQASLDGISATFSLDGPAVAGVMRDFAWTVTSNGAPAVIDRVMHGIPMHVYAVRADLAGDVIHMHPLEGEDGAWHGTSDFPAPGEWDVYMQFASGGTVYGFRSRVDVTGMPKAVPQPDAARERVLLGYTVAVTLPSRVVAGAPAKATFTVRHAYDVPEKDAKRDAVWTHNLIVVREGGEPQLWNHHGDGSVDAVANVAPVAVSHDDANGNPFDYELTFPAAGRWLIDFEYRGEAAPFWIDVEPAS